MQYIDSSHNTDSTLYTVVAVHLQFTQHWFNIVHISCSTFTVHTTLIKHFKDKLQYVNSLHGADPTWTSVAVAAVYNI